jgi:hypothetical protein
LDLSEIFWAKTEKDENQRQSGKTTTNRDFLFLLGLELSLSNVWIRRVARF